MFSDSQKIIIVGGNAAGPAAAAKAKRVNPSADVIMFEQSPYISTGTCELPYLLSGKIKSYKDIVFYDPVSFHKEKGVKVYVRHRVEKINRQNKIVSVRDLSSDTLIDFYYNKLILTTGSKTNKIPELDNKPQNLFYLKNVCDYLKIDTYLNENRIEKILIIGSGYIGLELAHTLREKGFEIVLIEREALPMAGAGVEIQHLILELLKQHKVEFIGGVEKVIYNLNAGKIKSIRIGSRIIDFDMAVAAIGFQPENNLAVSSRLKIGQFNGLTVDNHLRTSDPSIFAAGDNIEVINRITGRPDYLPLATIAHKFGHTAGANAAGANLTIKPVIKNVSFQFFDKAIVNIGLNLHEAQKNGFNAGSVYAVTDNLVKVMPESSKVFGKIIYNKTNLEILGASFLGGREASGYADLIATYIYHKIKATALEEVEYNYTPPLSPFVNLLSVLGRKIKNA